MFMYVGLQNIVKRLDQIGREKGLLINMVKAKIMTLNGKICNIILNGSRLEQVNTFQYLESTITEDARRVQQGDQREAGKRTKCWINASVVRGSVVAIVGIATDTIMLLAHNKQLLLVYA